MTNVEMTSSAVAVIPARSGSKRIPHKNIYELNGHPLMAYTIQACLASRVFSRVLVATDSEEYADIAKAYGAEVPSLRASSISGDISPDIEWVLWVLNEWELSAYDALGILRPTSPLRSSDDIRSAWKKLCEYPKADSIRAVSPSSIHPGKMWVVNGETMNSLLPFEMDGVPWNSSQTKNLPPVYFQNASLEIVWTDALKRTGKIAGNVVIPHHSQGFSGLDVNDELDIRFLEFLISSGTVTLPKLEIESLS